MNRLFAVSVVAVALWSSSAGAQTVPLITAQEAALPPASGALATRGITRGPGIRVVSPAPDATVKSPFNLKLNFEGRGGEKIDPASVRVVYLKSPAVDLTSRIQAAISPAGIDVPQADVPPGEHTLRVTVKDTAGRESTGTVTVVVGK